MRPCLPPGSPPAGIAPCVASLACWPIFLIAGGGALPSVALVSAAPPSTGAPAISDHQASGDPGTGSDPSAEPASSAPSAADPSPSPAAFGRPVGSTCESGWLCGTLGRTLRRADRRLRPPSRSVEPDRRTDAPSRPPNPRRHRPPPRTRRPHPSRPAATSSPSRPGPPRRPRPASSLLPGRDVTDSIPALRPRLHRRPRWLHRGRRPPRRRQRQQGRARPRPRPPRRPRPTPSTPTSGRSPKIGWDQSTAPSPCVARAVVALLDTGVDGSHPDLAGQLVAGHQHPRRLRRARPTRTATARPWPASSRPLTDNGQGIAGVGYAGVKVMPVTVLGADGTGSDSDIIEGVVYAVDHGADVINMSFSNPGFSSRPPGRDRLRLGHNVVVVAATGNDSSPPPRFPAGDRGVIGVSNTDQADALNASCNYGADTFLAAPGTDIVTLAAGRRDDGHHRHVGVLGRSRRGGRAAARRRIRLPRTASSSGGWRAPRTPPGRSIRPAMAGSNLARASLTPARTRSSPRAPRPWARAGRSSGRTWPPRRSRSSWRRTRVQSPRRRPTR